MTVAVLVERGRRRVFAAAADWPGWCRSGRDEAAALDALAEYLPRFLTVCRVAGVTGPGARSTLDVVEHLPGGATTDFGAPGSVAEHDRRPLTPADARRRAALVRAAWQVLDDVAATAPAQLRKGPRGGGRDRDAVVAHVVGAEDAYCRSAGLRDRSLRGEAPDAVAVRRAALLELLGRPGGPGDQQGPPRIWPRRYTARRVAWHVLDHAWEIEDRSEA